MSTIATKTQFNPAEFRRDFETLVKKNPQRASSFATSIASRLENALGEAEAVASVVIESVTVGGTAFALGALAGMLEERKGKMIDDWRNASDPTRESEVAKKARQLLADGKIDDLEKTSPFKEGDFRDPTTFLKLPLLFWPTALLATGAYFARDTAAGGIVKSAALGSFGAFTADLGRDVGSSFEANRAAEKKDENNNG